jgi:glycosyltransferase involved in cell wall biosynthesis
VSASHSDGSSVSLLEAMACGKPVVVSGIPGNREWVTPEENGWLFPDGDAASLADRILHAAEQPAGRLSALGHGGRVVVEARADWSRNQRKLLEAYQRAMEA